MRSATRKKTGRDPAYLTWLRLQKCFVCRIFQQEQRSPTQVCHVGERGLSQKCADSFTLPGCSEHHLTGPESLHRLGVRFWGRWGLDKSDLLSYYHLLFAESDHG